MPFLFQYLLKFSLSLAVLYTFYYFVLRPLTFYQWNRFYLLCYSLLSLIIPFINISQWLPADDLDKGNFINVIPVVENLTSRSSLPQGSGGPINWTMIWDFTGVLMLAGAAVMLIRVAYQYASLKMMKRGAVLLKTGEFEFYDVNGPISPFSFANAIFINSRLHTEEEFRRILEHEFVHVKQKHTIDIVIAELICVLNWFNPFAWLIRRAIRQNLEFIADNNVLEGGIEPRQYQYLLLKVMGISQYSITNNFSISSLKKRITMMNKMKSARTHLFKFLFVLPLLVVMLLAFRNKMNFQQPEKNTSGVIGDLSSTKVVDTVPKGIVPPAPPAPPAPPVIVEVVAAPSVKVDVKSAPVVKVDVKSAPSVKVEVDNAPGSPLPPEPGAPVKVKKVKVAPVSPTPISAPIPAVPAKVSIDTAPGTTIRIINKNSTAEPLYIVDGKTLPKGAPFPAINPDSITAIDVVKGPDAIALHGDKGVDGVVRVTTKTNGNVNEQVTISASKISIKNAQDIKALIILDGVEISKERFLAIDAASIKSMTVLKGSSATDLYKEKGNDGVIIISTK